MKNQKILYAITDRREREEEFYKKIEDALKGGVKLLQLREKNVPFEQYLREGREVKRLCKKYGVPLIINDSVRVALESGADGVHVGAEDSSVKEIKGMYPKLLVGSTAKTPARALQAEREGADYLGVGAVFPSPTKPEAIAITLKDLDEICSAVSIPVFAIGGITGENVLRLKGAKIAGVAVCSAVFSASDVQAAAKSFCRKLGDLS